MNDLVKSIVTYVKVPTHPAGWPFITVFCVVTVILFALAGHISGYPGVLGIVLTVWCFYFFRDPVRHIPSREGLIVAPGDGIVTKVDRALPPIELALGDEERWRVSIFLSVFNVHVNRIPIKGIVTRLFYFEGLFLNANLDKASEDNERQMAAIRTEDGKTLGLVMIAGLIARRIICDLSEGQAVETGERCGIIRFGSRVDLFLPVGVTPLVSVGQTAIGGETILADMASGEVPRLAVAR